jgi:RAC serine/threonine-protein kinase
VIASRQIQPPWKPDIQSDTDTKYIPDEFANEPVHLTPPKAGGGGGGGGTGGGHQLSSIAETEELPYFESFSYHGSRASLSSYLSNMSTSDVHTGTELYG